MVCKMFFVAAAENSQPPELLHMGEVAHQKKKAILGNKMAVGASGGIYLPCDSHPQSCSGQ